MSQTSRQNEPLASVLVYSSGSLLLRRCVQSVLQQDYDNLQIIIIDDTAAAADVLSDELTDPRLAMLSNPTPMGRAGSFNRGLRFADGEFICYLDDKCVCYPQHVRRLVEAMLQSGMHTSYSDFYTTTLTADRRMVLSKVLHSSVDFDRPALMECDYIDPAAWMHRTDLLRRTGHFDESLEAGCMWDLQRRLALLGDFIHVGNITGERLVLSGQACPAQLQAPGEAARFIAMAEAMEADGDYLAAARCYESAGQLGWNTARINYLAALAYSHRDGCRDLAADICQSINSRQPTVDSLLLQGRLMRKADRNDAALRLLRHAEHILTWRTYT